MRKGSQKLITKCNKTQIRNFEFLGKIIFVKFFTIPASFLINLFVSSFSHIMNIIFFAGFTSMMKVS